MYEELDVSNLDEKIMDEVWKEIEEENKKDDEHSEYMKLFLSTDSHGREHRGKGPGGGQFVSKNKSNIEYTRERSIEIQIKGEETLDKPSESSKIEQPKEEKEKKENKEEKREEKKEEKRYTYVTVEDHKIVIKKAINKLKEAPTPTEEEVEAAKLGVAKKGANKYRKDLVGNTTNRRDRRNKLLKEFGNGEECPCVYCGLIVTHGTMEQDKIYTTLEGGRYRVPNLVPSCSDCNKKRGDMPFIEAMKKVVSYVKSSENN